MDFERPQKLQTWRLFFLILHLKLTFSTAMSVKLIFVCGVNG